MLRKLLLSLIVITVLNYTNNLPASKKFDVETNINNVSTSLIKLTESAIIFIPLLTHLDNLLDALIFAPSEGQQKKTITLTKCKNILNKNLISELEKRSLSAFASKSEYFNDIIDKIEMIKRKYICLQKYGPYNHQHKQEPAK